MLSRFRSLSAINLQPSLLSPRYSKITMDHAANRSFLHENLRSVQEKINNINTSVRLVAVSKTKPASDILALYDIGHKHFGENYVQELVSKAQELPRDVCWHFIGHLQSQKAKTLIEGVPNLHLFESLDSKKLADKLNRAIESANRDPLQIYIQINTSGEDSKSGV